MFLVSIKILNNNSNFTILRLNANTTLTRWIGEMPTHRKITSVIGPNGTQVLAKKGCSQGFSIRSCGEYGWLPMS